MTNRIAMLLSLAIFAAYACAGCAAQVKTFHDMTPQERGVFFMSIYNAQFDDYVAWQDKPLTDDQRKIMQEKKRILTDVYPMIMAHNFLVDAGLSPPIERAEAIMALINQLVLLMVQGGQI